MDSPPSLELNLDDNLREDIQYYLLNNSPKAHELLVWVLNDHHHIKLLKLQLRDIQKHNHRYIPDYARCYPERLEYRHNQQDEKTP